MNQILYTIENEEEKNRLKSIVLFFGIIIIIFGILLVATGGYSFATSQIAKKAEIEAAKVPVITLSVKDNIAEINVEHSVEISKIEYAWNDEEAEVENIKGKQKVTQDVELPAGKNTLMVKVTDIEGRIATEKQEFVYDGTYMDVSVVDNKSLKIMVTDVKGFQSVSYRWTDGEEIVKYPDTPTSTSIEIIVDIPMGLKTITIKAINNDNVIETKEMQVQGVTAPKMTVKYSDDKSVININFKDDQGIKEYSYKVSSAPISEMVQDGKLIPNAKEKLTEVVSETKQANGEKEIVESVIFNEGFNFVEVTITNVEGITETITGWCAK